MEGALDGRTAGALFEVPEEVNREHDPVLRLGVHGSDVLWRKFLNAGKF